MTKDQRLKLILNDFATVVLSDSPLIMEYRDDKLKEIKALFPAQGVCADCKFEADNYCERGGSPVIRIGNSLSDITLTEFGCNLFEKKE